MAFGPLVALMCFMAYMGGQFASSMAVMGGGAIVLDINPATPEGMQEILAQTLGLLVLASPVGGLLAVLILVRYLLAGPIVKRAGKAFGLVGAPLRQTAFWTLIGGLNGIVIVLVWPLLVKPPVEVTDSLLVQLVTSGGFGRAAFIVLALLLAPPIEEFVFRGVMMHGLMRRLRPVTSAVIVSTVFVLLHVPEARHYWPALVAILFLATIAVTARLTSGSLLPAYAAHLAYNTVVVAPGFFA